MPNCCRFEYSVTPQELKDKDLEVTVKNDTSLFSSSQKELGSVIINLASMDPSKATTEWYVVSIVPLESSKVSIVPLQSSVMSIVPLESCVVSVVPLQSSVVSIVPL